LVALLGGVVAAQMPQALFFQQVFEAAGGLLRVVFRRTLDSRDSVVWLALAIGTRVVVAATALVLVVVVLPPVFCLLLPRMASYLALALSSSSTQEVIMSLRWVMELGEVGDGARAATTEVFEGATVIETVLEEVDDLLVGDVDYGGALVEEAPHVLAKGLALFLLHHCQVHASTRATHSAREVAGELFLKLVPLVDRVLLE
jgi:hypothetical protein